MKSLRITVDPVLPKLAWYANYEPAADTCVVEVGPLVEAEPGPTPKWVVAGAWNGPFSEGNFHRAAHVFGSGLRLDDDGLHVVPASSTIDRCVFARDGKGWHLSNSLMVLLGRMGARLDPNVDHALWSESPARGIHGYLRQIPVLHPVTSTVNQLIYESMRLSSGGEQTFFFRDTPTTFTSYADYRGRMEDEVRALWTNASDASRARPMRATTSTSRGYDSAAVTALATSIIPNLVSWTAQRSNTRIPSLLRGLMTVDVLNDDGSDTARRLGATPRQLNLDLSGVSANLEAWSWASAQTPPELAFHDLLADAATQPQPTLWFSGQFGDGVWGREPTPSVLLGHLTRSGQSGCSLIEARLASGVIDCAVPYLFARSMKSINAITESAELKPWRLDNDYDRPIPRRLLEERGIPRGWFGHGKKAVACDAESPAGDALRAVFFERSGWTERMERAYRGTNLGLFYASRLLHFVRVNGDRAKLLKSARRNDKRALARVRDLHQHTFLLCADLLSSQFARAVPPASVVTAARPVHLVASAQPARAGARTAFAPSASAE